MSDGDLYSLDVTSKEELAYRAYQFRMSGESWEEIALKLGFKNGRDAQRASNLLIKKATAAATEDRKQEILDLELDRLDALQTAVWGMAISGDLKAVDSVLKIMTHRARLLTLGEDTGNTSTNTIIVAGDNYVESLRELAEK